MSFSFVEPSRKIFSPADVESFKDSGVYGEIFEFVRACGESIVGLSRLDASPIPDDDMPSPIPESILKLVAFLNSLHDLIDEIPPIQQPMRFGNKAFRDWHARLLVLVPEFLSDLLPDSLKGASKEMGPYLYTSFGNETRIDYGTGHETTFVVFLLIMFKLRLVEQSDLKYLVLKGFNAYLRVVRRLQTVYILEPAGSHGVWGLDDYHCILFVWGAAQLCDHPDIIPSSIHDDVVLQKDKALFFYLDGINFIKEIKSTAPFGETSPMLNDISGSCPTWAKVYNGMLMLYKGEVLNKFPVIQHFLFGSIIKASWQPTVVAIPSQRPLPPTDVFTRRPHPQQQQQHQAVRPSPTASEK
jgi:hypothetical protein